MHLCWQAGGFVAAGSCVQVLHWLYAALEQLRRPVMVGLRVLVSNNVLRSAAFCDALQLMHFKHRVGKLCACNACMHMSGGGGGVVA